TVDSLVEHIMSEIPLHRIVREKALPAKKKLGAGWIVLIILGFPVWFPLIIAAFSVVLSLYITLWAVMISFYAVVFSLAVAAIVTLPFAAMFIAVGNPAGCVFSIGAGLVCAGLAILFFLACVAISKGIIRLTGAAFIGIKRSFIGKEGVTNE
ncbi:MAG: hypothetical protein IK096_00760, partial [Lachnospiraceae bacterium]|nr:hypothetical protein [Lachnospiraceae bacterium]